MRYFILFVFMLGNSCHAQIKIDNITDQPKVIEADKPFANVYKPLNGIWKGVFLVKQNDHQVQRPNNLKSKAVMLQFIEASKTVNTINVTQMYTSESPYFQRVSITDFYPDTGKTEQSVGVNKIQDGKMWCVVHKPNDTVIHKGSTPNKEAIVWQSEQQSPLKIEYFYETVSTHFYEIIGFGYYHDDNPKLTPKLWFYGKYERQ